MSQVSPSYKAGAASVCITPDKSLWLAGYAARTAPAHGKISDLYASALAFEDAVGYRFVIASLDVIAITPAIATPVAAKARDKHGLIREQLLLVPTHTHYGPEFRTDKQIFFNIPDEYASHFSAVVEMLTQASAQAIDEAISQLEPVRLFVRRTAVDFAHNRRRHGVVSGAPSPEDIVDHDVLVLDCINAAAERKAILFSYACHNTTIPPDDLRYCGDWAGFAKAQLQQNNLGATALFIPGAGADQDPEPHGSVALSQQYGGELANAIQDSFDLPGVEVTGTLRTGWEDASLPLQAVAHEGLQRMLASDDRPQRVKARFLLDQLEGGQELVTSYTAPIQVVRFGNELLLIALSGEPVVDWAHKFKLAAVGARHKFATAGSHSSLPAHSLLPWIAGYCNDMFGYLPTRRVQAEGGYEGGRANLWSSIPAPFTDEVEERITDAVERLVALVSK